MIPRGLRNHNPLNIKIGNDWQGESDIKTDAVFEQFTADEWGYRAAFIILRKYIKKYHRNTIRMIVDAWAPDGFLKQLNYRRRVAAWTGRDENAPISFEDKDFMCKMVQGMARVENGCEIDPKPIYRAYEMVCGS